ncbi:hypothetical protein DVH05_010439 [Phytophthora capsici]|nr:hypothetical protein DVH05_017433 [Phytophthora capsici]KAG1701949.1 hypothetical protein DVH05_010439 [Phytophthora capsici]
MLREQFIGVFTQALELKKQQDENQPEEEIAAAEHVDLEKEKTEEVPEQEEEASEAEEESQEKVKEKKEDFADAYKVLKTLHLVNLHQALGKEVHMALDFFSKVLLDNTRPPADLRTKRTCWSRWRRPRGT